MKNEYIIDSLLDTDLYKLTMQQGVLLGNLQDVKATHRFQCRTEGVDLRQFLNEIREEVDHLCQLRFTNDEIEYLRTLPFMEESYLEYIGHERFKLNRDNINIREDKQKGGHISITVEGNWFHTILFETPLLAIVSEVFTRN